MTFNWINTENRNDHAIGLWLLAVAVLVFVMIVVGGATRLTESGLSIVAWKPISGVLPPMSDTAWQAEFDAYKQYPEYRLKNMGMSLEEFKAIFWWEYGHRLLGRLIGLAFALPLLFFVARRMVRQNLKLTLFGLLALGGAQGLLGWFMVQSGLVYEPAVSHYRLAAHLGLAMAIMSALLWVGLGVLRPETTQATIKTYIWSKWLLLAVFLQILMGALVAGLDAGHAFNTWPLMDGGIIPPAMWVLEPWWNNLFDNTGTVQFLHRLGAYIIVALVVAFVIKVHKCEQNKDVRAASKAVLGITLFQVGLGIWTLLAEVPVLLGTLHQGTGALLLASLVILAHLSRPKEKAA